MSASFVYIYYPLQHRRITDRRIKKEDDEEDALIKHTTSLAASFVDVVGHTFARGELLYNNDNRHPAVFFHTREHNSGTSDKKYIYKQR